MEYTKREGTGGSWLKAKDLLQGVKAKLVSETKPIESVFEGKTRKQDVAKIRVEGDENVYNVSLNRATINALIDAFGSDSKNWVNRVLTVHKENAIINNRRVTILYLLPEGFVVEEDEGGYLVIVNPEIEKVVKSPENEEEGINPDDIPF